MSPGDGGRPPRSPELLVEDLQEVLADADLLLADGRDAFMADRRSQLAAEAVLHRIGEMLTRLDRLSGIEERWPDIDWRGVVAMRAVMGHDCRSIDLAVVWDALEGRLGPIREMAEGWSEEARRLAVLVRAQR